MKKLLAVVCVSVVVPCTSAARFGMYNNTKDSFAVERYLSSPDITISDCPYPSDEMKNIEILSASSVNYNVMFKKWHSENESEKSYLSFRNGEYEFRAVFIDEKSAMLESETASELHNNVKKDSYPYWHRGYEDVWYVGHVLNWLIVGPFRVVHFLEKSGIRGRSFIIEYATDNNEWMTEALPDPLDPLRLCDPSEMPPSKKQHWWSRLCCCCGCDDCNDRDG
jgi:hypothetical protein